MMIQQMMTLMHLEMQLRHQALVSYQEAQDTAQRMRRLDDVMALNEQLNEVGSILGMLMNAPIDRDEAAWRAAASGTESPPAVHHSPSSIMGGRFISPDPDSGSLLPRFRFREHDTAFDEDDVDTSADEANDASYATSNVDNAASYEDFDGDGSLYDSSEVNSYSFDGVARNSVGQPISEENVSVGGRNAGGRPMVSGSGTGYWQVTATMPAPSSSTALSGRSPAMLSHRHDQTSTPRQMPAQHPAVTVTFNVLHLPASARSTATFPTTDPHAGTLPHVQSTAGGAAAASRTPLTHNSDHARPAVAQGQATGSLGSAGGTGSASGSSRQPRPPSRNRLTSVLPVLPGSTSNNSRQTLPTSSVVAQQVSSSNGDVNSSGAVSASQQMNSAANSSQQSARGSSVSIEPWPILPATEPPVSTSVSTNRSGAVVQPAARRNESQHSQTRDRLARYDRPAAVTVTRGRQRAVQQAPVYRPPLLPRRSSVRNVLGRPAGPASVSTAHSRMVPIPHPPASSRQQSFGNQSTAVGRTQASSDMLRPRRRSEIAHEIMFPPQNDTEQ